MAALATALVDVAASLPAPLDRVPLSPILLAIVGGLALAPLARAQAAWQPGLRTAAGPLLKFAVVLVGLRLSLAQLGELGLQALPLAAGALSVGLALAWGLGRLLGIGRSLVALLAVGTAVCGASAIAATAPALRPRPEETGYALACVALFGLLATLCYPWLLAAFLPDATLAGLVLGAAIHDTAQVTAAALLLERALGEEGVLAAATVTKLLRNLGMLAVIPLVVWWARRGETRTGVSVPFPWFILGFVAAAALRTAGDFAFGSGASWSWWMEIASSASAFLFAMAMAAIGMAIDLRALRALGWRPALVALGSALAIGTLALGWAAWLAQRM